MVATTLSAAPRPDALWTADISTPAPSHAAKRRAHLRAGSRRADSSRATSALRLGADIGIVALGALLLGGLTSWGQLVLPDAMRPFANSASGWTLLAVALIWWQRRGVLGSALLGAVAFTGLSVGYALVSTARGFFFDPVFWVMVGLAAGPVVGAATAMARQRRSTIGAIGIGALAGLVAGDGLSGLVTVSDTTGWEYWSVALALATVAVAIAAIDQVSGVRLEERSRHGELPGARLNRIALLVATTLGVTAAYPLMFALLGGAIS